MSEIEYRIIIEAILVSFLLVLNPRDTFHGLVYEQNAGSFSASGTSERESFLLHYLALFHSYEIGMMKYLFFLYKHNFVSLYKVNYLFTVENLENAYKQKSCGGGKEEDWKGKKEREKR